MIDISILSQELDIGTLKFIEECKKNNFNIKYLLIAPKTDIHPIRIKQEIIKLKVFKKDKKNTFINKIIHFSRDNLFLKKIKQFIFKIILLYKKIKYRFNIEYLKDRFSSNNKDCFAYLSVVYSLEGIVTKEVLEKFKIGILNIHPAILPTYRGLDGGLWALKENGELGVSAYIMDQGIDTGKVIETYTIYKENFTTIQEYIKGLKQLKYKSYFDAINKFTNDKFKYDKPTILRSQNRGLMSEDILKDLSNTYKNRIS
jgi:methionyl-tRNA formyltransferase